MRPPASRGGRRVLRRPVPLAIVLRVAPAAADRAALAAWPDRPLPVDFAVAAGGLVWLTVGDTIVAYRRGELLTLGPGQAPPADADAAIPEYLPAFALNLAGALARLEAPAPGSPGATWAGFVETAAGLAFERAGHAAVVSFQEAPGLPAVYRARLDAAAAARIVRQALLDFRDQVLTLNPRLAEHATMQALQQALRPASSERPPAS